MLRIGIDIGGTFTDFVVYDSEGGQLRTFKILSDPANPANTVLAGLNNIELNNCSQIVHGSTVATNALLERKGAKTGLIATQGFKDILQIGRQNRPSLYDWNKKPEPALVPDKYRFELNERIDYLGTVITPLDMTKLDEIIKNFKENNIESVAICLLFSFLYPDHEQTIAERLKSTGFFVSTSSDILPEYREFERTSTTVVNAYVSPILERYLSQLDGRLQNSKLQIMQSNGGMISLEEAMQNGVRCIFSGPAGGIIGAQKIAQNSMPDGSTTRDEKFLKIITFDMGGTSTDVSLIDGQPKLSTDLSIGGYPIHLPILDIHTVGAGGGSIASIDPGGSLRVGPQSAGADPGPACYGKGDLPTVTDANLVLGRLLPDYFLGGEMPIDPQRSADVMSQLGSALGLSLTQTALGVIEVINTQMERALRVISVESGYDPRDFDLVSFGGAGGLHAVDLARRINIPRVIIPKYASTLSAFGMLNSEVIKDYVNTVMLPGTISKEEISQRFSPLIRKGKNEIANEGFQQDQIDIWRSLDLRYAGQSYELNVPFTRDFIPDFHQAHQFLYGYHYNDKAIEIVNIRVRAIGKVDPIKLLPAKPDHKSATLTPLRNASVELNHGSETIPIYNYQQLLPGLNFLGPALIASEDTTILISSNDRVIVDMYQNLRVDVNLEDRR
jgi:N-methylhydantoinase A